MALTEKKILLKGILERCPEVPFDDCPVKDVRALPLDYQLHLVEKMSSEAVDRWLDLHKACLDMRQEDIKKGHC